MVFDVEIVLRERNYAVTERIEHGREPAAWAEADVETVLKQILLAIDRVKNRNAGNRHVALRGFSWIVEPVEEQVVIAIEIPMHERKGIDRDVARTQDRACKHVGRR